MLLYISYDTKLFLSIYLFGLMSLKNVFLLNIIIFRHVCKEMLSKNILF